MTSALGWGGRGVQPNPLNESPNNGSIRLLVQVLVSPFSVLSQENMLVNAPIRLWVQFLVVPDVELFSVFDCTPKADGSTDKLRESDSDKRSKKSDDFADVI